MRAILFFKCFHNPFNAMILTRGKIEKFKVEIIKSIQYNYQIYQSSINYNHMIYAELDHILIKYFHEKNALRIMLMLTVKRLH